MTGEYLLKKETARRIWYALSGLCVVEAAGMAILAPSWKGGTVIGEINALALFVAGGGVLFLLLARTTPAVSLSTQLMRLMFALMGGTATYVLLTWGLWAAGVPIVTGTVKRGLMAENYWLGPSILAYTVVVWMAYRGALRRENDSVPIRSHRQE
ncbi:hypothetical protein [Burkholderia diffusa]|uniref:hypothetical protein n=1 Tax=Burkholderia diffusa TaxID=488732 RepID=UPI00158C2CF7|nr:hypothetical protein [Burkholderia diffusa]